MTIYRLYCLCTASSPEVVRYIGYTKKRLKTRLNEHLSESRYKRTHKDKWIQKVLTVGDSIVIIEMDSSEGVYDIKEKEKDAIKVFKEFGANLVNGTEGGDGVVGMKHTDKIRIFNKEKNSKKVHCFSFQDKSLYKVFPSLKDMIAELKLNRSTVGYVLKGKRNHHRGFTFSFSEIPPLPRTKPPAWNKGLKKHQYKNAIAA